MTKRDYDAALAEINRLYIACQLDDDDYEQAVANLDAAWEAR